MGGLVMFEKIDAIPWKVLILIGVVLLAIGLLVGIKFINFILVFAGFFLIFTGIQNRKKQIDEGAVARIVWQFFYIKLFIGYTNKENFQLKNRD